MSILFDMLAYQTELHFKMVKTEGITSSANATKDLIHNIQVAIEVKKNLEKSQADTNAGLSQESVSPAN